MVWFFSSSSSSSSSNKLLPTGSVWIRRNKRGVLNVLRWLVIGILFALFSFLVICRLELNARLYIRQWITPTQLTESEPLSSFCFGDQANKTTTTTSTKKYAYNFVPGIPVWEEYTCYDYASLLQPLPESDTAVPLPTTVFHTTWSSQEQDHLTPTHLATLRSFMATQPLNSSQLIVWIHPKDEAKLISDPLWKKAANGKTRYEVYSDILTKGTALESSALSAAAALETDDTVNLATETNIVSTSELLKLAVLYQRGGIWFDLNTLFVRDMTPLLGHEWIAQGKCQTTMAGNPFEGGGLMHFYPRSPSMCELIYGSTKPPSTNAGHKITKTIFGATGKSGGARGTRGAELYHRIYRTLLRNGIKPWSTLPWCFTDPTQCKSSNSLPSPLEQADFSPLRLRQTFAVHFAAPKKQSDLGSIYKYLQEAQQW
ncbi:hypothetical protein [Absidia glauca]|uniref:Alpha 1,4-glycosyltransferase domain-containing protein n=1 Tax=Absidia glauca TaxID=4829 RepID=A0A163JL61_ABSGL|nr:hypothetical protein [Absidia glauca]